MLVGIVEAHGAQVTSAASAAEGLAALEREVPDVVLSDIGMPGEDGYAFINLIRRRPEDELGRIPALALTAFGGLEEERRIRNAGYDRYLAKPVEAIELVRAVVLLAQSRGAGC